MRYFAKATKTAVIRNGKVIPAGVAFGIRADEAAAMDARGFRVWKETEPDIPQAKQHVSEPTPDAKPQQEQASTVASTEPAVASAKAVESDAQSVDAASNDTASKAAKAKKKDA